ncbi:MULTISPECIES: hypothetical protein [unclassified Chryseobacterium]|uniref:hypothetical protein n=1 Tax=unclassified Chryseobacterium TaxID=2593645 RepID=UPI001C5BC21A|nr:MULTISPECIES: hypothetical protein [unclassified Chryseobacterium]MBW3522035.1 hypothetical protein [Chryseobacterium sp. NKUCC03_KSP]MCD0454712.1 hypothetical protein [Chryseobacterium sp. LC2016-27]
MKKLLFAGAIFLGTLTFANTGNSQNVEKRDVDYSFSTTVNKDISKEVKIINNFKKPPRGYVTIEFDINCGGQTGHMTVTYLSDNDGPLGALLELANAINQGTIQGCQQMANHGLI